MERDGNVSESSAEIVTIVADEHDRPKKKRKVVKKRSTTSAAFTKLVVTHNNKYVVAATGEDKTVHVFTLDAFGKLDRFSERYSSVNDFARWSRLPNLGKQQNDAEASLRIGHHS